jgi:hypothetical protein
MTLAFRYPACNQKFAAHALRDLHSYRWRYFQARVLEQVIGFIMASQLHIKHSGGWMDTLGTLIDGHNMVRNIAHQL